MLILLWSDFTDTFDRTVLVENEHLPRFQLHAHGVGTVEAASYVVGAALRCFRTFRLYSCSSRAFLVGHFKYLLSYYANNT